jgi:hypothetical protein
MRNILLIFMLAALPFNVANSSSFFTVAWKDMSFTTEFGYHCELSVDKEGRITRLKISNKGVSIIIPKSSYAKLIGASANEVELYEDLGPSYAELRIPVYTYANKETDHQDKAVWVFAIRNNKFESVTVNPRTN